MIEFVPDELNETLCELLAGGSFSLAVAFHFPQGRVCLVLWFESKRQNQTFKMDVHEKVPV